MEDQPQTQELSEIYKKFLIEKRTGKTATLEAYKITNWEVNKELINFLLDAAERGYSVWSQTPLRSESSTLIVLKK